MTEVTLADGSKGFAVDPLATCPHVVSLPLVEHFDVSPCFDCQDEKENWVCLTCNQWYCSRYINGHMAAHIVAANSSSSSRHLVALSYADLSIWCFACDAYVLPAGSPALKRSHACLYKLKFGEAPPVQFPEFVEHQHEAYVVSKSAPLLLEVGDIPSSGGSVADRVLGCVFGAALGDAFGLATEFVRKHDVARLFPEGIPFPNFPRNSHSIRWQPGDWTDDTDQMLLIMRSLISSQGKPDERHFASLLLEWAFGGFAELGDTGGTGIGKTTRDVITHELFTVDPHEAAKQVWLKSNKHVAPNGAIMRTAVLGAFSDVAHVAQISSAFARVTHADPRCVAGCIFISTLCSGFIHGSQDPFAAAYALCSSVSGLDVDELNSHLEQTSLEGLELDEEGKIGYTHKCLGVGVLAARTNRSFKSFISSVALEGGDADTNGAVAGAVLGCRLGFSGLPRDWIEALLHKRWLMQETKKFLQIIW